MKNSINNKYIINNINNKNSKNNNKNMNNNNGILYQRNDLKHYLKQLLIHIFILKFIFSRI